MSSSAENKTDGKCPVELAPTSALVEPMAWVLNKSNLSGKYIKDDWRKGFAYSEALAKIERHIMRMKEGEWVDVGVKGTDGKYDGSGLPHLWHIITTAGMLSEYERVGLGETYNDLVDPDLASGRLSNSPPDCTTCDRRSFCQFQYDDVVNCPM